MASTTRNGGQTATTSIADFYACPSGTDERVEVRLTNKTAGPIKATVALTNSGNTILAYHAYQAPMAANESVDLYPSGWKMGEGNKLRILSDTSSALDATFSAVPAV